MAATKTEAFSEKDVRLAGWAKALAHPARVAILQVLAARQGCLCGELVEVLPLAQATVSQHLKALKAAGLVQGEVEGPRCCYCLDHAALKKAQAAFSVLFQSIEPSTCCD